MNSNELVKDAEMAKAISNQSMDFTRTLHDVTNTLIDVINSIRDMYFLYGMKEEDFDRKELNDTDDMLGKAIYDIEAAQSALALVIHHEHFRQQRNQISLVVIG